MTNLIIYGNINSKGFPQTRGKERGKKKGKEAEKDKRKILQFCRGSKNRKKKILNNN